MCKSLSIFSNFLWITHLPLKLDLFKQTKSMFQSSLVEMWFYCFPCTDRSLLVNRCTVLNFLWSVYDFLCLRFLCDFSLFFIFPPLLFVSFLFFVSISVSYNVNFFWLFVTRVFIIWCCNCPDMIVTGKYDHLILFAMSSPEALTSKHLPFPMNTVLLCRFLKSGKILYCVLRTVLHTTQKSTFTL